MPAFFVPAFLCEKNVKKRNGCYATALFTRAAASLRRIAD